MTSALKIPKTLNVVASCWEKAEIGAREKIGKYHQGAGEEFITDEFHGKFAEVLDAASARGDIERAFISDVLSNCPLVDETELALRAQGLIAQVTLHGKEDEAKTGGDLGLLISRPIAIDSYRHISIRRNYRRGLLCQAKLKKPARTWGRFTRNQAKVLPQRIDYLALLLYRYSEEWALEAFCWQLCRGASLKDMRSWLRSDSFPNLLESRAILLGLGNGNIGTDNERIVDEIICPAGARFLEIKIDWPGDGPGEIHVAIRVTPPQRQVLVTRG